MADDVLARSTVEVPAEILELGVENVVEALKDAGANAVAAFIEKESQAGYDGSGPPPKGLLGTV